MRTLVFATFALLLAPFAAAGPFDVPRDDLTDATIALVACTLEERPDRIVWDCATESREPYEVTLDYVRDDLRPWAEEQAGWAIWFSEEAAARLVNLTGDALDPGQALVDETWPTLLAAYDQAREDADALREYAIAVVAFAQGQVCLVIGGTGAWVIHPYCQYPQAAASVFCPYGGAVYILGKCYLPAP